MTIQIVVPILWYRLSLGIGPHLDTQTEIAYTHTLDIANAMEGYHLRSQSIPPEHTRTPGDVPSLSTTTSHAALEGPVEGLVPVGQSILSAGDSELGTLHWEPMRTWLLPAKVGLP